MELGTLEKIEDLRLLWKHEALNFTPWLAEEENISILENAIGIEISEVGIELPVGSFGADIVAK